MTAEDAHQIKAVVSEQSAAVEELSTRYRSALIAYFRRRAPERADAEDLAQEVFVRIIGLSEVDNPEAFLFQMAANLIRDAGRRMVLQRQYLAEESATGQRAEVIAPDRVYEGREQLNSLLGVLEELTEKTRDVFLLHRLERMKYHEIADLFGISVSAVEKHVMKALAHIARRMDRS